MTKVTLHYDLTRPLGHQDFEKIAQVHATYGMARVQLAPSLDKIIVDYDASRLMQKDVEAVLASAVGALVRDDERDAALGIRVGELVPRRTGVVGLEDARVIVADGDK